MATAVGFTSAITYGQHEDLTWDERLLQGADDYFCLTGDKFEVVPGYMIGEAEGTVSVQEATSFMLTLLKVVSYATLIIPLIIFAIKAFLRSTHSFVDLTSTQEPGHTITLRMRRAIQRLMMYIWGGDERPELHWYKGNGGTSVFGLTFAPDLVFKIVREESSKELTESRFAKVVKACEICEQNQLTNLFIPTTHLFALEAVSMPGGVRETFSIIAEQRLPVEADSDENHRERYRQTPKETIRDLATFIALTGFSDVAPRNIQQINITEGYKIALFDLEEMTEPVIGFCGRQAGEGLINCLETEEQIQVALEVAAKYGIEPSEVNRVAATRLAQLRSRV
ncbi:MAG: hypothetical protein HYX48_02550 [Chlamydiales bacterium]|nr:hypothetical protein [Chlamydiales bacterium]